MVNLEAGGLSYFCCSLYRLAVAHKFLKPFLSEVNPAGDFRILRRYKKDKRLYIVTL